MPVRYFRKSYVGGIRADQLGSKRDPADSTRTDSYRTTRSCTGLLDDGGGGVDVDFANGDIDYESSPKDAVDVSAQLAKCAADRRFAPKTRQASTIRHF